MPGTASTVQQTFQITLAPWNGTFKYGNRWAGRNGHNPWVWDHETNEAAPHLTTYYDDFQHGETLTKFHLTFPYKGQKHKMVHVHFTLANGVVAWSSVDVSRCGGDKEAAAADAKKASAKSEITALAQKMIEGAFP